MSEDLDPAEFTEAAAATVAACAEADVTARRSALLAETGLLGLMAPEEVGGLALPLRFAVPVLEAAGRGLLGYPLTEAILLARALSDTAPDVAEAICSGTALATIAWSGTIEDGVAGNAPGGTEADHVLVMRAGGGAVLLSAGQFTAKDDGGLDLELRTATVRPSGAGGGVELSLDTVAALHRAEKVLRAAHITGSAERCVELAVEYANERVQFGSPLSSFQALRHRLSRDRLAVETMRNAVHRAVRDDTGDDVAEDALAWGAAWLGAAAAGPDVAESAIQVFGGMGFTWEVPLHRHLRQIRTHVAHGDAGSDLVALGTRLMSGTTNDWYRELPDAV